MNGIDQTESLRLIGLLAVAMALLVLGILWNARQRAVYLWSLSGIVGAGYYFLLGGTWAPTVYGSWWGLRLLALAVLAAAFLKVVAVGLLVDPARSLQPYLKSGAALLVTILVAPFVIELFGGKSIDFSLFLIIALAVVMWFFVRDAYRLGQSFALANAKLFAIVVGAQLVLVVSTFVISAFSGVDAYDPRNISVSIGALTSSLILMLVNHALFISLILDLNIRRLDAIQQRLTMTQIERSRSDERASLLADMHDGLGAALTTARLKVEQNELNRAQLLELLQECTTDLHLMVDTLRDQGDNLGEALADYRFRTERRIGDRSIDLLWTIDLEGAPPLPPKALLQTMRIIQEALHNALKHASARSVRITARYSAETGFEISVIDDGVGIPEAPAAGRGIASLHRRARELGGTLSIGRRPVGVGTIVSLQFAPVSAVAGE